MSSNELQRIFHKMEMGIPVMDIARAHKIASNTLYLWRKQGYEITAIKIERCLTKSEKKELLMNKYCEKLDKVWLALDI